ncbi:MAG: DUF6152 family protein [Vicinamibacterales bacterium]
MKKNSGAVAILALLLAPLAADGHHSLSAVYDQSRRVSVEALVVEFHFVNPHPYLLADVRGADGATVRWRLEIDNRRELTAIGITDETWKPGDRIVASGSPDRKGESALYAWSIDRPRDRFRYEQVGGTPRIVPPR